MQPNRHPARALVIRPIVTSVLVIGAYYLVPVEPGVDGLQMTLRTAGTVVTGIAITWLIVRQVRHQLAEPDRASLISLLAALVGGVAFFALADYITAVSGPEQFVGLRTKTDALYFTLATLTTVGYGDVHAEGQIARGVVTVQLLFNLLVLATGASVLTRHVRIRARRASGRPQGSTASEDPDR
jgi:hypothetical protein